MPLARIFSPTPKPSNIGKFAGHNGCAHRATAYDKHITMQRIRREGGGIQGVLSLGFVGLRAGGAGQGA